LQVKTVEENYY